MPLYKIPQDFISSPKILRKCCTDACTKFYPSAFPNPTSLIGPPAYLQKCEHERRGYTQEEFTERLVNMTEQVLDGSKESTLHCATFFGMEEQQLEPYVNAAFLFFCVEKEKERFSFDCEEGQQTSNNREMMGKRRHWLDYPHFLFEAITAEMKNHVFKGSNQFWEVFMFRAVSEHIIHGVGMQPLAKHYMLDQHLLRNVIDCCVAKLVFCLGEEGALNERIEMVINQGTVHSIQSVKEQENEEVNNNIENYQEKNTGKVVDDEKPCATETGASGDNLELEAKQKKGTAAATKGTTRGRKRKATESDQTESDSASDLKVPEKRPRGRPRGSRNRPKSATTPAPVLEADRSSGEAAPTLLLSMTPRKRGRPPKKNNSNEELKSGWMWKRAKSLTAGRN